MFKHTTLLYGLLGLMTLHNNQAYSNAPDSSYDDPWFAAMHTSMRAMHESMIKSMQEMQKAFDTLEQSVPSDSKAPKQQPLIIDANDSHVVLTLSVPQSIADGIKAERTPDTMSIEVPQERGTTKIRVTARTMSIEQVSHNLQEEGNAARRSYMERTLPHVVDMSGDVSIEHVQEQNTLNIQIARKHPTKKPQSLPILKK